MFVHFTLIKERSELHAAESSLNFPSKSILGALLKSPTSRDAREKRREEEKLRQISFSPLGDEIRLRRDIEKAKQTAAAR
jgi:hypothetical protein